MCTFLLILALAWLFAPAFSLIFALLAILFIPALIAGLITAVLPGLPFGLAYAGVLSVLIYSVGKESRRRLSCIHPAGPSPRPLQAVDRLTLVPEERTCLPAEEQELMDGCKAMIQGFEYRALSHFRKAVRLADGAFLAGALALKMNHPEEYVEYLSGITERERELGRYYSRWGISVTVRLPISVEVCREVSPDLRGVLLALSQAYMKQKLWRDAQAQLQGLRRIEPYDTGGKLAMAECLLSIPQAGREAFEEIIRLSEEALADSVLTAPCSLTGPGH